MSKAVNRTAVNRTAGCGRLWALAALLLAVFLASFFLGRYGVSLSPGQFLGLMADALLKVGSTAAHYGEKDARMEGWARILWGLGPLFGGDNTALPAEQQKLEE